MAKLEPAPDASMDEILASIRRIITEDEGARKASPGAHLAVVATSPPPREAEGLARGPVAAPAATPTGGPAPEAIWRADLPRAAITAAPPAASIDTELSATMAMIGGDDEPEVALAVAPPAPVAVASAPAAAPAQDAPKPAQRVEPTAPRPAAPAAKGRDDSGLLSPHADAAVESAFGQLTNIMLSRESRSLEDIVKDMMRPMLKDWLDDNLPPLVERLVREEINRVSRGRR